MRVLHVVHGLGSGVETAMSDYVAVSPEHEHHLFFSPDPTCEIARTAPFASQRVAAPGPVAFGRALRAHVRRLRPDVVHAHSSVAGALTRSVISHRRVRIVYTPHCFAFERRDVGRPVRAAFWMAEALLARRTTTVAACSPHEEQLARRFGVPVQYVPNVAHLDARLPATTQRSSALRVAACGRISAQKDPGLLAAIARASGPGVEFEWVGGGAAELTSELQDAGVHVTGWVNRDQALARLARADVYLHTARWESAPMSVLEAAALGVPVFARDTAAMRALGCDPVWTTPEQACALLADDAAMARARHSAAAITAVHTRSAQASALSHAYGAPVRAAQTSGAAQEGR